MALRPDSPVGQIAAYVEGLETEVAAYKAEVKKLDAEIVSLEQEIMMLENQPTPVVTPSWEVKADTVIAIAKAFDDLKIPYVFGGETISGMDCSGFVQFIYRQVGVEMYRVSKNQAEQGEQINKKDSKLWRKGDLVAFDYDKDGVVDHIGIYLGNGTMIHTNTPSTGINIKAVNHTTSSLVSVNRVLK
jgi:cell wall-associated NlpC family hydrolase